jgi:membrane-bound lytic murein transglycosylase F
LGGLALIALVATVGFQSLGPPLVQKSNPAAHRGNVLSSQAVPRDLADLRVVGELRVVSRLGPGGVILSDSERSLLMEFAQTQGLRTRFLGAALSQLLPALEQGQADLVAGARNVEVREGIRLTLPWGVSGMQVVGRVGTGRIRNESDLLTRQVAAKSSSQVWNQLRSLAAANPTMDLIAIPESESIEVMLDGISSGRYDLLVTDSAQLEPHLSKHPDLQVALDLTPGEPRSWAVRAGATELLASLNSFLNRRHLELEAARSYREDLAQLRERRVLRLITAPGPVNYYVSRGRLKGFEYDLVRRFAEQNRMRVDVVTADSVEEMRRLLLAGRGDLIAASLPADAAGPDLAATRPYDYAAPVVVSRAADRPLVDVADLAGRRIVLPTESPYLGAVRGLQREGVAVTLEPVEKTLTAEQALEQVAQGRSDLAIIGSNLVRAEFARRLELRAQFALTEPAPMAWIVRGTDRQLLTALDEFLAQTYQSGFYKALYSRYVERPTPLGDTTEVADADRISPYDDIVQEYANHYDFDWRLIVAQMFQESHFDPNAESVAGASGLMQMLPETAAWIGAENLVDPRHSIRAGLQYMNFLRSQFEEDLNLQDRTWFTLAAYNAGFARVQKARARAAAMDLDPDRWFDNVELAMMSLARSGAVDENGDPRACRCGQAVVYVRDIRSLYNSYLHLTRAMESGAETPRG